jgi:hypothetical protein
MSCLIQKKKKLYLFFLWERLVFLCVADLVSRQVRELL